MLEAGAVYLFCMMSYMNFANIIKNVPIIIRSSNDMFSIDLRGEQRKAGKRFGFVL